MEDPLMPKHLYVSRKRKKELVGGRGRAINFDGVLELTGWIEEDSRWCWYGNGGGLARL